LHERLGRPQSWVYRFRKLPPATLGDLAAGAETSIDSVEPWTPILPPIVDSWRFEGESEWPPLAQRGGAWAEPSWVAGTCASNGRALAIHDEVEAAGGEVGEVVLDLPIPRPGGWRVTPRLYQKEKSEGAVTIAIGDGAAPLATWEVPSAAAGCSDLSP